MARARMEYLRRDTCRVVVGPSRSSKRSASQSTKISSLRPLCCHDSVSAPAPVKSFVEKHSQCCPSAKKNSSFTAVPIYLMGIKQRCVDIAQFAMDPDGIAFKRTRPMRGGLAHMTLCFLEVALHFLCLLLLALW